MRPHSVVVIGYHGCDEAVGLDLVNHRSEMIANEKRYHWLGSGVYFWENDRDRAFEWAQEKASRNEIRSPFVIGAVIELRRCLDLSVRENVPLIGEAYKSLAALCAQSGTPLPVNKPAPKDPRKDNVLRFLDCAVINHLIDQSELPFDTVRGLFVEGERVYEGAEIFNKTHVEIAVRDLACIRGLFLPL